MSTLYDNMKCFSKILSNKINDPSSKLRDDNWTWRSHSNNKIKNFMWQLFKDIVDSDRTVTAQYGFNLSFIYIWKNPLCTWNATWWLKFSDSWSCNIREKYHLRKLKMNVFCEKLLLDWSSTIILTLILTEVH